MPKNRSISQERAASARRLRAWIYWAAMSFPVPDSPIKRTLALEAATRLQSKRVLAKAGDLVSRKYFSLNSRSSIVYFLSIFAKRTDKFRSFSSISPIVNEIIFKIKKYFSGAGKKIYEKKFRGLFKYIKIWYSKHIEIFYNAQNMD